MASRTLRVPGDVDVVGRLNMSQNQAFSYPPLRAASQSNQRIDSLDLQHIGIADRKVLGLEGRVE